jgi:hypothetical protein
MRDVKATTAIVGVDLSTSSIALAGIAYTLGRSEIYGPDFISWRWQVDDHYFDRISDLVDGGNFLHDLLRNLNFSGSKDEIYVAVEEPWPIGMVGKAQSNALKQQAEFSGAFLGGLLKYGVTNLFQIPANQWRMLVAHDLGITIHHSKWKDPRLCETYNCKPADVGKFRAKQWALKRKPWGDRKIPDWPDIVPTAKGRQPRPEGSRAKAFQCDDRYDALAIMEWCRLEFLRNPPS